MEFQTRPEEVIYKYDAFKKNDVHDLSIILDEMLSKYPDHKYYVYDSIGIKEKDANNAIFSREQFRNALNFYLKEKVKC